MVSISISAPTVAPTGLEVTSVDPYSVQMKWNVSILYVVHVSYVWYLWCPD